MKLFDWIRSVIFGKRKLQRLPGTPNNERLTFISNDEIIRINDCRTYKVWYMGNENELLNWYTNQEVYGWAANPIYNRNNVNLFWGLSSVENEIKRVHSGIPTAVINTLCISIVGKPNITADEPNTQRLEKILKVNDFYFLLMHKARVMTAVEGDGCWKININKSLSDVPLIEYYGSEDWEPIVYSGLLIGVIFKTYYRDKKNRKYMLAEIRRLSNKQCYIEYRLFKLDKNDEIKQVKFEEVEEVAAMQLKDMIIPSNNLFAVPSRYYYNQLRIYRGKSMYEGKISLFDMLDETLSQASRTCRLSTPVEYIPVDLLQRTKEGQPIYPKRWDREFIKLETAPDGDGRGPNEIQTTQPDVNFDKYIELASAVLNYILIGDVSPSSLGIDIAKKDNADAQREKEKQSLFTRNTIIDKETEQLKSLLNQALILQDYIDTGLINDVEYDISIKYDEFANPSFESELQVLGPAWTQGEISTKRYVDILWAGKLSDEDMAEEIAYLEENKQKDQMNFEDLMNEGPNKPDLSESTFGEEETTEVKE